MKNIFKKIIILILNWEARLVLKKYKPKLVGVTGSVGKTSTKEAVALVLGLKYHVRKSEKSYNSEFGMPLTVLGCKSAWNSPVGWLKNIFEGLFLIIFDNEYPECLVLELGADRPGDIKNVVKKIKFDVAVMTRLPDVPVHIEFFKNKEQVIEEKNSLALSIAENGLVVLNGDDEHLTAIKSQIKAKCLTYGQEAGNDIVAEHPAIFSDDGENKFPAGITFKIKHGASNYPVKVYGVLGQHQIYPILSAVTVGIAEGINMISVIEKIATYEVPAGRMRIIGGINNSLLLDDTYNASPIAVEEALKTLGSLERTGRKICVIGDMMELGQHTAEAHKKIGELASQNCDLIVTTGVRTKFIDEAALAAGFPVDQILHFNNSTEAGQSLREIIGDGDIVLLKGSQSTRMEKAVELLMAHPEEKEKLLVRQEEEWRKR